MKILLTGGCGYKGTVLAPKLLDRGHHVTIFDTQWFGKHLHDHQRLAFVKDDIRAIDSASVWARRELPNFGACIHLAGIANDPCGELDAKLTWEVNVLGTLRLAEACARAGVRQFIFASSASVYGLKDNVPVTEATPLEPVSDYNKTKMAAERVLLSYARQMQVQIVRPATVCGVSPRMRLDTVVNMLTAQALAKKKITAHCGPHGAQLMRPNVHIEDITDLYVWMLEHPQVTGTYNAGFENLTVGDTAAAIARVIEKTKVTISEVPDKRSYAVDSSKLLRAGFRPTRRVADAIDDIVNAWRCGLVADRDNCYNLKWMKKHGLARGTPTRTPDTDLLAKA